MNEKYKDKSWTHLRHSIQSYWSLYMFACIHTHTFILIQHAPISKLGVRLFQFSTCKSTIYLRQASNNKYQQFNKLSSIFLLLKLYFSWYMAVYFMYETVRCRRKYVFSRFEFSKMVLGLNDMSLRTTLRAY